MLFHTNPAQEFYTPERCFITEIINQAASPGISIAQARVIPGETTQLHALSLDEYYYILSGQGDMELNGQGWHAVKPGDVVQILAGQAQRIRNTGQTDLLFLCICNPRFVPDTYTVLGE